VTHYRLLMEACCVVLVLAGPCGAAQEASAPAAKPSAPAADSAAPASAPALRITAISVRDLPTVRAHVEVTGDDGAPVHGLLADNFEVREDGVLVLTYSVHAASTGEGRLAMVLAIDHSLSMRPEMVADARKAALRLIEMSASGERIGLITFAGDLTENVEPTTDRDSLKAAIDRVEPAGMTTALYDAASEAVDRLAKSTADRKAVILLTDGKNDSGRHSRDEVVKAANDAGVCLQTIGLGASPDSAALSAMASSTGGSYYGTSDSRHLVDIYEQIAANLHSEYTIQFSREADALEHSLSVRARRGSELGEDTKTYMAAVGREPLRPVPQTEAPEGSAYRATLLAALVLGALALILVVAAVAKVSRRAR
jgi:VWFA-related protein